MFRNIETILLVFFSAALAYAHEPVVLDARRATPGVELALIAITSNIVQVAPKYRLHAVGFPRGMVFNVWTKDFGHPFHESASGFKMDATGNLVSSVQDRPDQPGRQKELIFTPGPFPAGAGWELALVSDDRSVKAFAKAIPFPLSARTGTCTIGLELVSKFGDRFLVTGDGFSAGSDVVTELRYSGMRYEKRLRISGDGKLPPQLLSHAADSDNHSARYLVKDRACEVAVEYEWGMPALRRR